jgi:hypothetical protein
VALVAAMVLAEVAEVAEVALLLYDTNAIKEFL